ncbi:hypothetical protein CPVG_00039, partial [Cyanophage KBS-S-1A]
DIRTLLNYTTRIESSNPTLISRQTIGRITINWITSSRTACLQTSKGETSDVRTAITTEHRLSLSSSSRVNKAATDRLTDNREVRYRNIDWKGFLINSRNHIDNITSISRSYSILNCPFRVDDAVPIKAIITVFRVNVNNTRLCSKCTTRSNTNPSRTIPNRKGVIRRLLKPRLTYFPVTTSRGGVRDNSVKPLRGCSSSEQVSISRTRCASILLRLSDDVYIFNLRKINTTVSNAKLYITVSRTVNGDRIAISNTRCSNFNNTSLASSTLISRNGDLLVRVSTASSISKVDSLAF